MALAQLILRYIRLAEPFFLSPEENVDLSDHDAYFGFRYRKSILLNLEEGICRPPRHAGRKDSY